jgi:pilus assembly protein CpaC
MHRQPWKSGPLWGRLVLVLLAGTLTAVGRGQDNAPRPSALVVPINGTVRLQMTTRRPIRTVVNPKENVVNIRTVVGDPTTVLVIGQQPDVTRIELTDVDGRTETYEVIVQADIEYLRTQLRRAVPTANVVPIPTSNNTVILSGTVARAEDVAVVRGVVQSVGFQYVDAMRVAGVQQVQLDVIVARVQRADLRSMSYNFLVNSQNFFLGSTVGNSVSQPLLAGVGGQLNASFLGQTLAGVPGSPNGTPTNIITGVLHNGWGYINFLNALRIESLAKLVAEPRLVTITGRPASFLDGGEQAVPQPAGFGVAGVTFQQFGTQLNFIPIVLGNGKIRLEVQPEVSVLSSQGAVSIQGTSVQGRVTQRVNTTVELESGQTFVIGGLIQNQVQANTNKVPILGDLPFLGAFFSSKSFQETETELVVLVTPWLVDPQSCDQLAKVLPGMETRRPDDFELFLEGLIEAPRGPRQVFQHGHYVAAYKNSPSSAFMPCAGKGQCGPTGCGPLGCGPTATYGLYGPDGAPPAPPMGMGGSPGPLPIPGLMPGAVPGGVPYPMPGPMPGAVPAPPMGAEPPMAARPVGGTEESAATVNDLSAVYPPGASMPPAGGGGTRPMNLPAPPGGAGK